MCLSCVFFFFEKGTSPSYTNANCWAPPMGTTQCRSVPTQKKKKINLHLVSGSTSWIADSPEWLTASISTGNDPRRRDNNTSRSERLRVMSRLKRYHVDVTTLLPPPMLALLQPASDGSPMIGLRISAPPDDRRRRIFFLFLVLPLQPFRPSTERLSQGTEPRRWIRCTLPL